MPAGRDALRFIFDDEFIAQADDEFIFLTAERGVVLGDIKVDISGLDNPRLTVEVLVSSDEPFLTLAVLAQREAPAFISFAPVPSPNTLALMLVALRCLFLGRKTTRRVPHMASTEKYRLCIVPSQDHGQAQTQNCPDTAFHIVLQQLNQPSTVFQ